MLGTLQFVVHEPHAGSDAACQESRTISYQQQSMPSSLTMGVWPTGQPRASTSCILIPGEGGRVHPRLHDSTAPEENVWPTTSLWTSSLRNQCRTLPDAENAKQLREIHPYFLRQCTSLCLFIKFHNDQVPRYGQACPAVRRH
jgi:hypothetical protein